MKKTIIAMLAFVFVSISGISYAADKVFALVPGIKKNVYRTAWVAWGLPDGARVVKKS